MLKHPEKVVPVPAKLLQVVLNYLAGQPYAAVAEMVQMLTTIPLADWPPQPKIIEVPAKPEEPKQPETPSS